jgi:predicted NBD/HSP70 family sugar kinase
MPRLNNSVDLLSKPGTIRHVRASQPTGVNLHGLRRHNRALLLTEIRRAGGLSRIQLAARTGLTQQAISKIVPELLGAGLLDEQRQPAAGVGKPRTLLRIRSGARHALGAQLDRDELRLVRTDLSGRVTDRTRRPLPPGCPPERTVATLARCVRDLGHGQNLLGLGVGTPGPLDHQRGVVHQATGDPARRGEVALREALADATGLPVILDKDTNAAAHARLWRASGRAPAEAVVLAGTGIGAGLVIEGRVYRGPRTNAGEFGHTTLAFEGPRCACGRRGCVEVLHRAAAAAGDHAAAARLLGIGLLDLVQVLDLERIVLAGRAVRDRPGLYLDAVATQLAELLPLPHWQRIELETDVDEDLVALGAAAEVLDGFYATAG